MADATLTAELRPAGGKRLAGRFRREGLVPGVVYGLGGDSVSVTVNSRELAHLLAGASGSNTVITLKVGGKDEMALARQIQRNPLNGHLVHVDFIRVRADQEIQAEVPVHLIGTALGSTRGGVLEQQTHSVTVDARPADVPAVLELDVSELMIGEDLRVSALVIPKGVTLRNDLDDIVVLISAPRVAEVAEPVEGEAAAGAEAAPAEGATTDSE